jgi:NitT/TauT family transport system permease protein
MNGKNKAQRHFLPRPGGWLAVISLLVPFVIWQVLAGFPRMTAFILPYPLQVAARFGEMLADGSLLRHTGYTLLEVLAGLALGAALATLTGYALAKSRLLERLLSPYLVASQAMPVVAIAPLLVIWFGPGLFSKVLICALTVFFPILVNTMVGLRGVPPSLRDLMGSLRATPAQVLRHLELPAALPALLGGLRIGATLSVIGAVVGEFVGSDRGLGFLVNVGRGRYDTALVFVAVFTLIGLALLLYGIVSFLETKFLRWQETPEA